MCSAKENEGHSKIRNKINHFELHLNEILLPGLIKGYRTALYS